MTSVEVETILEEETLPLINRLVELHEASAQCKMKTLMSCMEPTIGRIPDIDYNDTYRRVKDNWLDSYTQLYFDNEEDWYYYEQRHFHFKYYDEWFKACVQQNSTDPDSLYWLTMRLSNKLFRFSFAARSIHLIQHKASELRHRRMFKSLQEELIAEALSPNRLMKQLSQYDDFEEFFDNI